MPASCNEILKFDLFDDFQEVAIWNPQYLKNHTVICKPWHEYFSGTMTELHLLVKDHPILSHVEGFFRIMGNNESFRKEFGVYTKIDRMYSISQTYLTKLKVRQPKVFVQRLRKFLFLGL